jgi:DNA polymerase III delta subunit
MQISTRYNTHMKIVLYGTSLTALYEHEKKLLSSLPGEKLTFNASKQTIHELHDTLGAQSMFPAERTWRIINLEKLRSPKQRQSIVELLSASTISDSILVTIPAELTPAQKKLFHPSAWKLQEFKLPKVFFQFTESIKTQPLAKCHQLLTQSLQQKNEWELHSLLARQLRLLLATKVHAPVQAPPFALSQLKKQAQSFTSQELINALHTLFHIELSQKSGQAHLTWSQEIDRLLTRLYDEMTSPNGESDAKQSDAK